MDLVTEPMDDIRKVTSQTAALILNKLEMIYPNDNKLALARKAILGSLGDRGLNVEIRRILASHRMEGQNEGTLTHERKALQSNR